MRNEWFEPLSEICSFLTMHILLNRLFIRDTYTNIHIYVHIYIIYICVYLGLIIHHAISKLPIISIKKGNSTIFHNLYHLFCLLDVVPQYDILSIKFKRIKTQT